MTGKFYFSDPAIRRKREMMMLWAGWLDEWCAKAVAADPVLSDREALVEAIYRERYTEEQVARRIAYRSRRDRSLWNHRIAARASSDPANVPFAQAIDLATLHKRERAEFKDLIDKGHLKRRTAYYLRRVGELFETGAITPTDAERIGWTKLQIIADKITGKNVKNRANANEAITKPENNVKNIGVEIGCTFSIENSVRTELLIQSSPKRLPPHRIHNVSVRT